MMMLRPCLVVQHGPQNDPFQRLGRGEGARQRELGTVEIMHRVVVEVRLLLGLVRLVYPAQWLTVQSQSKEEERRHYQGPQQHQHHPQREAAYQHRHARHEGRHQQGRHVHDR